MFYKATPSPIEDKRPTAAPNSAELPDHMQQLVDRKIAQLDQAIASYQVENERTQAVKRDLDQQIRKVKIDQRELDAQRKRLLEDVERTKAAEYEKI